MDNVLDTFNSTTDITFTVEHEQNNQVAFLVVLLTKNNDETLYTRVEETYTDQVPNYNSNHPTTRIISCIKTVFKHIDTHRTQNWLKGPNGTT